MMEEEVKNKRKWKIGDIFRLIGKGFLLIIRGEFIYKLKVEKYLPHIAYTFFLFAMAILFSMLVDMTMAKEEQNKEVIKELEVEYVEKSYELVKLDRRTTVDQILGKEGSKVREREKEVIVLR